MSVKELVVRERYNNPCATLLQIGNKYGVSKQWVSKILETADLPTKHWKPSYICNNCSKEFFPAQGRSKSFCSTECRITYATATLVCEECGKLFQRKYSRIKDKLTREKQQHFYCSRVCRGKATGREYGFLAHPENTISNDHSKPSRWAKFLPQIIMKLKAGENISNIMAELGIPRGSYNLIKKLASGHAELGEIY
jgi:hypothetical protein